MVISRFELKVANRICWWTDSICIYGRTAKAGKQAEQAIESYTEKCIPGKGTGERDESACVTYSRQQTNASHVGRRQG